MPEHCTPPILGRVPLTVQGQLGRGAKCGRMCGTATGDSRVLLGNAVTCSLRVNVWTHSGQCILIYSQLSNTSSLPKVGHYYTRNKRQISSNTVLLSNSPVWPLLREQTAPVHMTGMVPSSSPRGPEKPSKQQFDSALNTLQLPQLV